MDQLDITVSNFMDRSICLKRVKELFSAYAIKSFSHGLSPIMRSKMKKVNKQCLLDTPPTPPAQ